MQLPLNVAGGNDPKTCGDCAHFHRVIDPSNIRDQKGECREGPPSLTMLPANTGAMMQLCGYPTVAVGFPACSRHRVKVAELVLSEANGRA